MIRILFIFIGLFISSWSTSAQSHRLHQEQEDYFIFYVPTSSLPLVDFAQIYKIPAYKLALMNRMDLTDSIIKGKTIKLPILPNHLNAQLEEGSKAVPIITKVEDKNALEELQNKLNLSTFTLINLNEVQRLEELLSGYFNLGYLPTQDEEQSISLKPQSGKEKSTSSVPLVQSTDHMKQPVLKFRDTLFLEDSRLLQDSLDLTESASNLGVQYQQQLREGLEQNANGAAVFYKARGNAEQIFALYNLAPIGSIVKITNPANKRTVYAKVIGKIPPTERYKNAIIGISGNAGPALQSKDFRLFVQTFYVP